MRIRSYGIPVGLALVQGLMLAPLFRWSEPAGDDLSIHLAEIAQFVRAFAAGDTNLWIPTGNLGYAGAFYYQSLPQLLTALPVWLLGTDLVTTFKVAIAFPLVLLPITVFAAVRIVGGRSAAASGAAFAVTFTFTSWPWMQWSIGFDSMFVPGLFTQAWGTLLYPIGLAYTVAHLRNGRCLGRATLAVVLTGLCHPFLAISLVPAILATATVTRRDISGTTIRRAAGLVFTVLVCSSFFWLPILLYYDDFGAFPFRLPEEAGIPLGDFGRLLLDGTLLDDGRAPILQLALLVAVIHAWVVDDRTVRALLLQAALFLFFLLVGPLLKNTNDNLLSPARFIPALQLALAAAAGIGLVSAGDVLLKRWRQLQIPAVVIGLLVAGYVGRSAIERAQVARVRVATDYDHVHRSELSELMRALAERPDGRVLGRVDAQTHNHWWRYLPSVYAERHAVNSYGGAARQSSPSYAYLHEDLDVQRHHRVYAIRYLLDKTIADWPERVRIDVHRSAIGREQIANFARSSTVTLVDAPVGYFGITTTPERYGDVRAAIGAIVTSTRSSWRFDDDTNAIVLARTSHFVVSELPIRGYFDFAETVTPLPTERPERRRAALQWLSGPGPTTWSSAGQLLTEASTPSRYSATVRIDGSHPIWVTVAVNHHAGWRARVDEEPAPIARILPAMMAVRVMPGTHDIVLEYKRPSVFWWLFALAITAGGLLAFRARAQYYRRAEDG